jgi:hypothetical protein
MPLSVELGPPMANAERNGRLFVISDHRPQVEAGGIPIERLPLSFSSLSKAIGAIIEEKGTPVETVQPPVTKRIRKQKTPSVFEVAQRGRASIGEEAEANWLEFVRHQSASEDTAEEVHRVFDPLRAGHTELTELLTYTRVLDETLPGLDFPSEPIVVFHESETVIVGPRHPHFALSRINHQKELPPDCSLGYFTNGAYHMLAQVEAKADGDVAKAIDQMQRRDRRYLRGRSVIYNPRDGLLYRLETDGLRNYVAIPKGSQKYEGNVPDEYSVIELPLTLEELLQVERQVKREPIKGSLQPDLSKASAYFNSIPRFNGFVYPSFAEVQFAYADKRYFKMITYLIGAEFLEFGWRVLSRGKNLERFHQKKELFDDTVTELAAILSKGLGFASYCLKNAKELDVETKSDDENDLLPLIAKIREHLDLPELRPGQPFVLGDVPDLKAQLLPTSPRMRFLAEDYAFELFARLPGFLPHIDFLTRTFTGRGLEHYRT